MGIINLTRDEREAINAIDEAELKRLVDQAISEKHVGVLHHLPLSRCGAYVSQKLHHLQMSMRDYAAAKSGSKMKETKYSVESDARSLIHSVWEMKAELEKQEEQATLFYVDDHIMWPHRFTTELRVRIGFRWRGTIEDDWSHGNIVFTHIVDERPDYATPAPKRKPSAAKLEEQRQRELASTWEHFMSGALCEVRDLFQAGGNGAEIPEAFTAIPDPRTGHLNNFSTDFSNRRNKR